MKENPRWDAYGAECQNHGLEPTQEGFEAAVMEIGREYIAERLRAVADGGWTAFFLHNIGPYIAEQAACRAEAQRDAQEDR